MSDRQDHDASGPRPRRSLALVCGVLTLVMIAALPAFLWWGHARHGMAGLQAGAVAVAVCWLSGLAALLVSGLFVGTQQALNASLGSIGLRTMLPLVVAIFLDRQVPVLAQAGVFGMIVAAYLISLTAETLLLVWLIGPARPVAKAL